MRDRTVAAARAALAWASQGAAQMMAAAARAAPGGAAALALCAALLGPAAGEARADRAAPGGAGAQAPRPEPALTFAVVPQRNAEETVRRWSPLTEWLTRRTGIRLRLVTAPDIPSFESCLARGAYDLAYMNPYHFVVFNAAPGYRALAHRTGKGLQGVIVARTDGGPAGLEGLAGRPVAFPSPAAFGASILQRAEMKARGIDVLPRYVRSHDSVYLAVARGRMAAGGGVMRTLRTAPPEVRAALRVIHTTEAYTPHAVAAHPRVPAALRDRLQGALEIAMAAPDAPLAPLGISGFVAADDAAWDDVRALSVSPEEAGIHTGGRRPCPSD